MNWGRFAGIGRQCVASINEALREMICDPLRAADGRRGQIVESNRRRNAIEKKQSARQLEEFRRRTATGSSSFPAFARNPRAP